MITKQTRAPAVLALGLLIALAFGQPVAAQPAKQAVSTIERWVLHYDHTASEDLLPTHIDLLRAVGPDMPVLIGTQDASAAIELREALDEAGINRRNISIVPVGGPVSPWARDRYVWIDHAEGRRLLVPPFHRVEQYWKCDPAVGRKVQPLTRQSRVVDMGVYVEGGDMLVADKTVLVGYPSIAKEMTALRSSYNEIVTRVEAAVGRKVLVIGNQNSPHDHMDMFLSLVDDKTVVLSDPTLSKPYFEQIESMGLTKYEIRNLGTCTYESQEALRTQYEAIAQELIDQGFTVHRLPMLQLDTEVLVTWTNVVLDHPLRGKPVAYVPKYGIRTLDEMAFATWKKLGFDVKPIRCDRLIVHGGAVRCASNPVRRSASDGIPQRPEISPVELRRRTVRR